MRDAANLPFLMRELNNLSRQYPQVRIWECPDSDAIVNRIEKLGPRIFAADAAKPAGR